VDPDDDDVAPDWPELSEPWALRLLTPVHAGRLIGLALIVTIALSGGISALLHFVFRPWEAPIAVVFLLGGCALVVLAGRAYADLRWPGFGRALLVLNALLACALVATSSFEDAAGGRLGTIGARLVSGATFLVFFLVFAPFQTQHRRRLLLLLAQIERDIADENGSDDFPSEESSEPM
jgi:hypothetical protein